VTAFVLADQFRADREIIDHFWDVLDDPQLNKALGLPQNSRMSSAGRAFDFRRLSLAATIRGDCK
jgi:hypothetical protein